MRCKFCGSKSLHSDSQHKSFSTGKAVAGAAVFGVYGAAAGLIGKDKKGYRCGACGAFMEAPMDVVTEAGIDNAIIAAKNGDRSMYDYYRRQYPHIEEVALPAVNNDNGNRNYVELEIPVSSSTDTEVEEAATIKHSYRDLSWDRTCPVYVESVTILSKENKDYLKIDAVNIAQKSIRSAYFMVSIFDDTGDKIDDIQCVFQNQTAKPGESLSKDTEFALNTGIAYRAQVVCEKAAFSDDSVWRRDENAQVLYLQEQVRAEEGTFPRYQYMKSAVTDESQYDYSGGFYLPVQTDEYWMCVCGLPIKAGCSCPRCGFDYERAETLTSQKELRDRQKKSVRDVASKRAEKTTELYAAAWAEESEVVYKKAKDKQRSNTPSSLEEAAKLYETISEYKDSTELAAQCREQIPVRIEELRIQEEKRQEERRKQEEERKRRDAEREAARKLAAERAAKRRKTVITLAAVAAACIAVAVVVVKVVIPNSKYNAAMADMKAGDYTAAAEAFEALDGYKDSSEKVIECNTAMDYNAALALKDSGEYETAIKEFKALGDYQDSAAQIEACKAAIKDRDYNAAVAKMESNDYEGAIEAFSALGEYSDSAAQIEVCKTAIKDRDYDAALALLGSGEYKKAKKAFKALDGYKDSEDKIKECNEGIKKNDYDAAMALKENGDYQAAKEAFEALGDYSDSEEQVKACKTAIKDEKYDDAVALMEIGAYQKASDILDKLKGYKDSEELKAAAEMKALAAAEIGETVYFGKYEQDNSTTNGSERIEWIVLEKQEDMALVISKYALDCRRFNNTDYGSWEKSTLRKWFNNDFREEAFTPDEAGYLIVTNTDVDPNIPLDKGAEDYVFALSTVEAKELLPENKDRKCEATPYAKARGAVSEDTCCRWWLRIKNQKWSKSSCVDSDGIIAQSAYRFQSTGICARPAMWISLELTEDRYQAALSMVENGEYEEAITAFEALGDYSNSAEQLETCQTAIKDRDYNAAVALKEDGKYEEAITAFEALGDYSDSAEQLEICQTAINERDYKEAEDLMESGYYKAAITVLEKMGDYKDASSKIKICKQHHTSDEMPVSYAVTGDEVVIGQYEQDNNTSNGTEPLQWIVLDEKEDSLLVITKYVIDLRRFNKKRVATTWEDSTSRSWLNGKFLETSFTDDERAAILTTKVNNENNPRYKTSGGNDTEDKVFYLSVSEAKEFFGERNSEPTSYVDHFEPVKNDKGYTPWLLRTPADESITVCYVANLINGIGDQGGNHNKYGQGVYVDVKVGIRPAMWISRDYKGDIQKKR